MEVTREQRLARGLREGRSEAWHALYEEYARPVWQSVARLMGPQSADVADVVQETFLAAARSARTYDSERGSLGRWLLGIARRHVALHYRRQVRQDRVRNAAERLGAGHEQVVRWLENRHPDPPEALASAETAVLVRAALAELAADYQTLLTARYLDGVAVEQLAEEHGCTTVAVRSKLARARRAFRAVFARFGRRSAVSPGDPTRGAP
jgi:RNA polymerase sigma-70 factor (ECF subfamily)